MQDKLDSLKNLRAMVKEIILEMASQKQPDAPDASPEHEAKESSEMEAMEHISGQEMQDEEAGEENASEENASEEGEEDEKSPFGSDKERMLRNMYKGGDYKGMMAGKGSEEMPMPRGRRK